MQEIYDINLFGSIQTFEIFTPLLKQSSLPRVVFVSSALGTFTQDYEPGNWAIYRSTKSALNMMVRTIASEGRFKDWKINLTCPGYVATNLNDFKGIGTAESGAINSVRLATLGPDGETRTLSNKEGALAW